MGAEGERRQGKHAHDPPVFYHWIADASLKLALQRRVNRFRNSIRGSVRGRSNVFAA
jgi:hypothetical protein